MFENFKNIVLADASREIPVAALVVGGNVVKTADSKTMAMEGFTSLLASLVPDVTEVNAFVLCEGPGSVLGTRVASLNFSICSLVARSKIFSYDGLRCSALAYAAKLKADSASREFSLLIPSRKGFANIIDFCNPSLGLEREIEISELLQLDKSKLVLWRQREKIDVSLSEIDQYSPSMEEIWSVLKSTPSEARPRTEPIDSLSLAEREYVKWKAPALI